jgi:putative phosphoesterase
MAALKNSHRSRGLDRVRRVGLISDTHGLIRPEALDALRGSEIIIHCGDIGEASVLETLRTIAPVRAIRGNNDKGAWAGGIPSTDVVEVGGRAIYVLHNVAELDLDPSAAGFSAVVFGHSHKPAIEMRGGTLFVNPGSAGPRRFTLPVTVATLTLRSGRCDAEIVELDVATPKDRAHRRLI